MCWSGRLCKLINFYTFSPFCLRQMPSTFNIISANLLLLRDFSSSKTFSIHIYAWFLWVSRLDAIMSTKHTLWSLSWRRNGLWIQKIGLCIKKCSQKYIKLLSDPALIHKCRLFSKELWLFLWRTFTTILFSQCFSLW